MTDLHAVLGLNERGLPEPARFEVLFKEQAKATGNLVRHIVEAMECMDDGDQWGAYAILKAALNKLN
jgi:hypothetical protein